MAAAAHGTEATAAGQETWQCEGRHARTFSRR